MKRKLKKIRIGRKSIILAAVSLILVCMTAVGATASWIEEVSQVEFSNTDGQSTPLYIGDELLKSDASVKQMSSESTAYINLKDYFYKSGGMHLSPCYGDGENFYFPVQSHTADAQTTPERFRVGTKDDANVNYLSATFRISSPQANTVYWLQELNAGRHIITFKDSAGEDPAEESDLKDLWQYLRLSITIDGATTVYAYNDDGKYNTVSGSALVSPAPTGRAINKYIHYDEDPTDTDPVDKYKTGINLTKQNQGAGSNLNGNTLFTVNKGATKEVTVKLWLEYNNNGIMDVSVSNINLSICSSWAKKRRIYVRDSTVAEATGRTTAKWLSNDSAKLVWALKSDVVNSRWEMTRVTDSDNQNTDYYKVDVPAVYNNEDVVLLRLNSSGGGSKTYSGGNTNVNCEDYWETAFPDTFHSETYTVCNTQFGTWETIIRYVKIINSCHYTFDSYTNFAQPFAYMWDSSTDTGADDKVVQNASWPGVKMIKLKETAGKFEVFAFYYNSVFDRIIFNDDFNPKSAAYQTEDIDLSKQTDRSTAVPNNEYYNGKYYDMATMQWYDNTTSISYSSYALYSNVFGSAENNRYTVSRMINDGTNTVSCRIYVRYESGTDSEGHQQYYNLKIMSNASDKNNGKWYGKGKTQELDPRFTDSCTWMQLQEANKCDDLDYLLFQATTPVNFTHPGVYKITFYTDSKQLSVSREYATGTTS